jgi:hypothetical protein
MHDFQEQFKYNAFNKLCGRMDMYELSQSRNFTLPHGVSASAQTQQVLRETLPSQLATVRKVLIPRPALYIKLTEPYPTIKITFILDPIHA